jgi:hypothetical protein
MIERSRFYAAVRQFAVSTPVWGVAIRYFTLPDEVYDLTLVSQRVYGNREEWLAVMAAAGLDTLQQPLVQQDLVLPTPEQLLTIKASVGLLPAPTRRVR